MMGIVLLSIGVVALVMLAMAVGTMFSGRCLRGSCGALGAGRDASGDLDCGACPLRPRATPAEEGTPV